jgi:hypothetical protein
MSSRSKSTRNKKVPEPAPAIPSQTPSRPRPRAIRPLPVVDERAQLVTEYLQLYDKAEAFKNDLAAAEARMVVTTGRIFTTALVSSLIKPSYAHSLAVGKVR